MTQEQKIDQRIFDLYDEYCHGRLDRREFLSRAAAITIGGVSALWMAQALMPQYAEAQTISQRRRPPHRPPAAGHSVFSAWSVSARTARSG